MWRVMKMMVESKSSPRCLAPRRYLIGMHIFKSKSKWYQNNVIEFYLHQSLFILFTEKTRPQGKSSLLVIFVNGTYH